MPIQPPPALGVGKPMSNRYVGVNTKGGIPRRAGRTRAITEPYVGWSVAVGRMFASLPGECHLNTPRRRRDYRRLSKHLRRL